MIPRACDVALKERRKIIIVPRETPLSVIHIENMRKATVAGAVILPPVPGFYPMPKTIEDVVDFVVGKILNDPCSSRRDRDYYAYYYGYSHHRRGGGEAEHRSSAREESPL